MQLDPSSIFEVSGAIVTIVGGIYGAIRHFLIISKRKEDLYREGILIQANEKIEKIKFELEEKLKELETELHTQKEAIEKDLSHFKQLYGQEVKMLGEKIETLREDLSRQHQSLVDLLSKLIER